MWIPTARRSGQRRATRCGCPECRGNDDGDDGSSWDETTPHGAKSFAAAAAASSGSSQQPMHQQTQQTQQPTQRSTKQTTLTQFRVQREGAELYRHQKAADDLIDIASYQGEEEGEEMKADEDDETMKCDMDLIDPE